MMNTERLKAQVRKFLQVRPGKGLPPHARLEVVITLRTNSGDDLLPPVSHQVTVLQPLHEEFREVHLNTVQRTLKTVTDVMVKAYAGEFKRQTTKPADKSPRIPNATVVPLYPDQPDPQVANMLDQTKSRAKVEESLPGPSEHS